MGSEPDPEEGGSDMPDSTSTRRWLTQSEAAERLGVTDRTIRNYIARGSLPGHRVRNSRLVRVDITDVDAMLRPIPAGGVAS